MNGSRRVYGPSDATQGLSTVCSFYVILKLSQITHSNSRRREAARFLFAPNASSSRLRRWDERQRSVARRPPAQRSSIVCVRPAWRAALPQKEAPASRALLADRQHFHAPTEMKCQGLFSPPPIYCMKKATVNFSAMALKIFLCTFHFRKTHAQTGSYPSQCNPITS